MVGSEVESSVCDLTGEGKKTPVPPQGSLLGFIVIGCIGVSMTIGAPRIPHGGIISIASLPLSAPFGKANGLAVSGCQRVIADFVESSLPLKKVMLTLLLGDGHITCFAMSALFPLITKRDLQGISISNYVL
ncbi:unnamed protein product [Trifolium pratense]|uniref:Uncharacterized protein n=1 Tax=Trifolium pratense TaxID=57577 RepID=A0ACB0IM13_TRIPR|nr:unnamed protein product [Trifolium pratense]